MSDNPQRSWAKVNTQLWSLAMRDPITTKNPYSNTIANSGGQNAENYNKKGTGTEWKDICCWRYNKNRCIKRANECKFQHRCSHCGSQNHIYLNCPKRKRGSSDATHSTPNKRSSENK